MRKSQALLKHRDCALERAEQLKQDAMCYLSQSRSIPAGKDVHDLVQERQARIMHLLGANQDQWQDWKWQLKNRIKDVAALNQILHLSPMKQKRIEQVGRHYRWAISPYYLSLIDPNDSRSPIYLQAIPDMRELMPGGSSDPMGEERTSPAPLITRRYPDRLIINVTNQCAMFCRHCQRRRNIGTVDSNATRSDMMEALDYITRNPEIRDVLITGGDALLLGDRTLDWLLQQLSVIPHVEIIRLGTRVPVTLPQRVTPALCSILKKYPPIYINTQFNHPLEVTPEADEACARLIEAGVVLGNQAVLLRDINDSPEIMRKLNHELLKIRVRPYYIFHAKEVSGTLHFRPSITRGLQIMESLRGHTSGLAVPTYIYNAPGGLGKIPIMPNYMQESDKGFQFRTWEGKCVHVED